MATWESASIAFLAAAEGTEQIELTEPGQAVRPRAACRRRVPAQGKIQMFNHLDRGDTMDVDVPVDDAWRATTRAW